MKNVEILEQNPQLWQHDLKTIIKTVGKSFSYDKEIEYI